MQAKVLLDNETNFHINRMFKQTELGKVRTMCKLLITSEFRGAGVGGVDQCLLMLGGYAYRLIIRQINIPWCPSLVHQVIRPVAYVKNHKNITTAMLVCV